MTNITISTFAQHANEGRNSKVYRLAESVHEQLPDEAKDDIIDWLFDACVENGDPIELAQYYLDDKTEV